MPWSTHRYLFITYIHRNSAIIYFSPSSPHYAVFLKKSERANRNPILSSSSLIHIQPLTCCKKRETTKPKTLDIPKSSIQPSSVRWDVSVG